MNDLSTTLSSVGGDAEYDAAAKAILSDKQVLAWILRGTTTEFSAMTIEKIIPLIENPSVTAIAVNPGLTNISESAITGMSQESNIPNEKVVYYDIRFFVKHPRADEKRNFRIIVDLEAQKTPYPGYDLVTRGIFYCSRMLSEQAGRNLVQSNYDSLDKVYSIWICLNCPAGTANTISRYSIKHSAVYGDFEDSSRHDLLQVVMVRLPGEKLLGKTANEPSKLHNMLYDLIVWKAPAKEKIAVLKKRYGIKMEDYERRIDEMCNLSQGLIEQGLEQGAEKERRDVIVSLLREGKTPEEIHAFLKRYPLDVVREIQQELHQTV